MVYIQKPHSKDDDFIKRGGRVGAVIAFGMTFAPCCLVFLFLSGNSADKLGVVIGGLTCTLLSTIIMASCGSLLGKSAARRPSVNAAFLQGAIISGLTIFGITIIILAPHLLHYQLEVFSRNELLHLFCLLIILTASGTLISGLAAIYVRDYRQSQTKRWIPQFTLQEMIVVFTIISIIISAMTSFAVLRW